VTLASFTEQASRLFRTEVDWIVFGTWIDEGLEYLFVAELETAEDE
jgi:hypothetical protein